MVYKVVYDLRLPGVNCSRLVSSYCYDEVNYILKMLIAKKKFDVARKLASSCDLDPGLVSIEEVLFM